MRLAHRSSPRRGMTLLEVLVAMAIFLFSILAIGQLMRLASQHADDVRWDSRATRLAQSKLAEYIAGVETFQGNSSGNFEEEPDWQWKVEAEANATAQNLWTVSVTVSRDLPSGKHIEASISQFILDPTVKGNASVSSSSSTTTTGGGK